MKSTSDFKVFIGVDQTGAVTKGKPKKLPVAIVTKYKTLKLYHRNLEGRPLYVPSFTKKSFKGLLSSLKINCKLDEIFIVADCVLGLPQNNNIKDPFAFLKKGFQKSSSHPGFGLKPGSDFFTKIEKLNDFKSDQILRKQEKELNCLSVFRNTPYQKNIQTGTYRIWKELGTENEFKNFCIWPYEISQKNKISVCEVYPSFCRKNINQSFPKNVLYFSKDHEDAALSAWYAATNRISPITDTKEGFILV